jgi:hypothetical protein
MYEEFEFFDTLFDKRLRTLVTVHVYI